MKPKSLPVGGLALQVRIAGSPTPPSLGGICFRAFFKLLPHQLTRQAGKLVGRCVPRSCSFKPCPAAAYESFRSFATKLAPFGGLCTFLCHRTSALQSRQDRWRGLSSSRQQLRVHQVRHVAHLLRDENRRFSGIFVLLVLVEAPAPSLDFCFIPVRGTRLIFEAITPDFLFFTFFFLSDRVPP